MRNRFRVMLWPGLLLGLGMDGGTVVIALGFLMLEVDVG